MRPFSLSLAIVFTRARGRSSAQPKTPSTSNAVTPGDERLASLRPGSRRFNPHAARDLTTRLFSEPRQHALRGTARSFCGGPTWPPCAIDALPRAAAGVRAVSGVRRVVGVAGAGAAGAGRFRHRVARHAGEPRDRRARARALRPRQVDCRAVPRLAGGGRPPRFRPLAAVRPAGPRAGSRARGQHRDPRAHRAARRDRSSACRSASSPAAGGGGVLSGAIRAASLVLLSMPPLLTSLFLVFVAARTGWFPIAGMRSPGAPAGGALLDLLHHLVVPAAALGAAARGDVRAAAGAGDERGRSASRSCWPRSPAACPRSRVVWRDALKAALRPVAAVYGLVVGTLLSGSFAVEVITAWPGLGQADARRAARARRLSGGRLRRRRLAVPRGRHALSPMPRSRSSIRARARRRREGASGRDAPLGLALVPIALAAAAAAPLLAPHAVDDHFDGLLNAPPTHPARARRRRALARAVHLRLARVSQLEQRYEQDRSARVPLVWCRGGHLVRSADEARGAAAAARRRQLRPRRVQPAAVRRARSRSAWRPRRRSARCSSARRSARIAGYAGGALDDVLMRASDFVLVLPAMYVALALRSVLPLVLAAADGLPAARRRSSPSSARRSSRAACAPSCARSGSSTTRPPRSVARRRRRAAARAASAAGGARLHRRADHAARAGVHRRRSDAVVRRARVSRSDGELGHDAARRVRTSACSPIFRGCSARRRRCFSSCSGLNLVLQGAPVADRRRPTGTRTDGSRSMSRTCRYVESSDEPDRRLRADAHAVRRPRSRGHRRG